MKISNVISPKLSVGGLVLARVGLGRGTSGASDFSASGTTQAIVITALNPGDVVNISGIKIDVITPVVHAATFTARLGIVGDDDRFIGPAAGTDVKSSTAKVLIPNGTVLADTLSYVNNTTAAINLVLTVQAGSGNISDATAGELQVLIPISRVLDRVTQMEA